MDQAAGLTRSNEIQNLIKSENMPRGITPQVMPITEDIIDNEGGLTPQVMPITEDILNQGGDMPMMSEEEKRVFTELFERGVPEDMIIDIMASAKVGATIPATAVNPAEFGGLPKTGSSPASGDPSMPTAGGATGAGMNQNDMAMYLQNKVAEIKGRTGGNMGALSGVPAGNQTPMAMPKPRPAVMPQRLGADRTFNPMDQLTPTNAPNT